MALLSEALVQRSEDRVSESWQTVQDKATMWWVHQEPKQRENRGPDELSGQD